MAIPKAEATETALSAPAKGMACSSGCCCADVLKAARTASRRTKAMTPPIANRNSFKASGFPVISVSRLSVADVESV